MAKKRDASAKSSDTKDADLGYTLPMRVFGGVVWGTLLSLGFGALLVVIPQYPRSGLWAVPIFWVVLSGIGVALQWNVARGACPKCGKVQIVPAMGKRCPECRSYLKAVNRRVMRY